MSNAGGAAGLLKVRPPWVIENDTSFWGTPSSDTVKSASRSSSVVGLGSGARSSPPFTSSVQAATIAPSAAVIR